MQSSNMKQILTNELPIFNTQCLKRTHQPKFIFLQHKGSSNNISALWIGFYKYMQN